MPYLYATFTVLGVRLRDRMQEDRGQTAAEYLGIVVIVAILIAALSQSKFGAEIGQAISSKITDIAGNG